jgi:hypothetical protein
VKFQNSATGPDLGFYAARSCLRRFSHRVRVSVARGTDGCTYDGFGDVVCMWGAVLDDVDQIIENLDAVLGYGM